VVVKLWLSRPAAPNKQWKYLFMSFFLLAFGDIFHLIPRTYLWYVFTYQGDTTIYDSAMGIQIYGFGLIMTGITMTIFYLGFYYFWKETYLNTTQIPALDKMRQNIRIYDWTAIGSVIIRTILILLPWNNWGSSPVYYYSVFSFRVLTNLPLYVIGMEVLYLFYISSKSKEINQHAPKEITFALKNCVIWIIVSYVTYTITLFGVPVLPILGMMMIPKTIAYLIVLYYMYRYIMTNPTLNTQKK